MNGRFRQNYRGRQISTGGSEQGKTKLQLCPWSFKAGGEAVSLTPDENRTIPAGACNPFFDRFWFM